MTSVRKLLATMVLAGAMIFGAGASLAQEQPPDPHMLLNLDLFATHHDEDSETAPAAGEASLLDQIRALLAMGYLGAPNPEAGQKANTGSAPAPFDYQYEAPR
jgi:hypothetical protein